MADETYVMNVGWVRHVGRSDLIDDVADQFERPARVSASRPQREWHTFDAAHRRTLEPQLA
jgi:hypothetical protein